MKYQKPFLLTDYSRALADMFRHMHAGRGTDAGVAASKAHHLGRLILKRGGTMKDLKGARKH